MYKNLKRGSHAFLFQRPYRQSQIISWIKYGQW